MNTPLLQTLRERHQARGDGMIVNGIFDPNDEVIEQIWIDGKMSGMIPQVILRLT